MATPTHKIILNDIELPLASAVAWDRVTPYPDQVTQQAPTEADFKPVSKQTWGKLTGGAGIEKWESPEDNDRFWESDGMDTAGKAHAPGPAISTMGSFGAAPAKIIKHDGTIWAIAHQQISRWDPDTGSWTSLKTDFDSPTDAILYFGNIA